MDPKKSFKVRLKPMRQHMPDTKSTLPSVNNDVSKKHKTPRKRNIRPNTVSPMPIFLSSENIAAPSQRDSPCVFSAGLLYYGT
mmetsp:Transcript_6247/g.12418  ORF Transcript_6247/g.12418 Transcript_6247/m.12418 type:complete len:83 (+) Transcript_6247:445-693(+)